MQDASLTDEQRLRLDKLEVDLKEFDFKEIDKGQLTALDKEQVETIKEEIRSLYRIQEENIDSADLKRLEEIEAELKEYFEEQIDLERKELENNKNA